ncbi:MAG: helix-turn-helix domain-containing protein [Muribaculaceae bacterium]|nr:helix-turn-helix domain-containing protein [Muribaculaceae bacterium]MDE6643435.1 helix-turn-helix domain-containing protein [Muribaculaceae bacterium]
MDIVSRLKTFLDTYNISNSQFADNCGIPRPTLSQLLTGRNKKISDEIISKIHARYPALSVMWLLFNEGPMVNDVNIQFSEPQNSSEKGVFKEQFTDFKEDANTREPNIFDQDLTLENSQNDSQPQKSQNTIDFSAANLHAEIFENQNETTASSSISVPTDGLKKITNIVVFYSDNSFQSFQPTPN